MASGSYNSSQSNGATLSIPASAFNIRVSLAGASGASGGSDNNGSGGNGGSGRSGTFSLPNFTAITIRSYSGGSGGQGGSCFGSAGNGGSSSVARGGSGGNKGGCSGSGGGGGGASGVYSVTHGAWIIVAGGGGGGGGGSWNRGGSGGGGAGGFSGGGTPGRQSGSNGNGASCGDGAGGGGGGGGTSGGGGGSGGCDNQSGGGGGGGGGSGYNNSRATLISQGSRNGGGYVSVSYSFKVAEIQYFRATPNPRTDGTYDVTLEWDIDDAGSASIDQSVGSITLDADGNSESSTTVSTGLSPSNEILTKTYTLTVNGLDGNSITQSVTVAMVNGSIATSHSTFFSSGEIKYSALRDNFKGTSGSIKASELVRNASILLTNPIVPDCTENRISGVLGNGVPDSESDISLSRFRNTIKYYNITQTGGSIDLNISSQDWNNNLDKNISKTFTLSGNCDSSDTYYYQSPQTPAVKFNGTTVYNLNISVTGTVEGSNGMNDDSTSNGATSRTGSKNATPNGNGGNAMEIDVTTGNITIDINSNGRIIKGSKFSGSYSDGAAITGTNYTVTGTINGTTIQGSYLAS